MSLTVKCPTCSLQLADVDHPDVVYERDGNNNILCPNDGSPMLPIGAGAVMHAEEAFKQANRELGADLTPPNTETTETLTKRLREIERARGRVINAQERYETKRDAAKEAKKHLDEETTTFLTIVGRLSAVPAVLPLFSQEAHDAAAVDADGEAQESVAAALWADLMEHGYMAASLEMIGQWDDEQRARARAWCEVPTLESLPTFMRVIADENEASQKESTTTSATA